MEHIVLRDGDELFTTSEIIANRAKVSHSSVMRLIDTYQSDLEDFGLVGFEIRPRLEGQHGGADKRIAKLNEQQSTLLLSYMRNNEVVRRFKRDLVKGFFEMAQRVKELEQQSSQPAELTKSDLARMVLESESEKAELQQQAEINAPKVEYHERFVAEHDEMTIRTVASVLDVGEHQLRALLVANEWIYREESERWSDSQQRKVKQYRYSAYSHKKPYFIPRHEHKAPRFRGEVMHYLKVTPTGANAIDRLLQRVVEEYGELETAIRQLEARRQARSNNRKDAA